MDSKKVSESAKRDLGLVDRALNGDQRAYTELMSLYRDSVFFMMKKMIANTDDAEDLTIEAFGKAFKRLAQYSPDYAFSTWLFKIASNNCIDFLRRKKLGSTMSLDAGFDSSDDQEGSIDVEFSGLDPEQALMKEQRIDEMHRIVEQLKPKYKQLVEMRYFKELSYEEISVELDLPLGTVKAQLFRARELMFEILKHTKNTI
jgi:RNA polymerase sigma factor (sigma-70 family)